MEGLKNPCYAPQSNAATGTSGVNNPVNFPSYTPQPFMFSFPPPPLTPSVNPQCYSRDANAYFMQPGNFTSHCDSTNVTSKQARPLECTPNANGHGVYRNDANGGVSTMNSIELSGPYPVLLTPGSFVQNICGNGGQAIYQQYSPGVPSQLHSMYPINVMSTQDQACTNPSMVSMAPVCSLEYTMPSTQLTDTVSDSCASQFQLMTPSEFERGSAKCGYYVNKELLSPNDFDAGYSSSNDLVSSPSSVMCAQPGNSTSVTIDVQQKLQTNDPIAERGDKPITDSEKIQLFYPVNSVAWQKSSSESEAHASSSNPSDGKAPSVRMELTLSHLLNTAMNLNAVSFEMLKTIACRCCKRRTNSLRKHLFRHCCTRLHANVKTLDCVQKGDGNTVAKTSVEPAPDIFNRWPNIPPPPDHESQNEIICQNQCCGRMNCAPDSALPLAAALFHNDQTECCSGALEEDAAVPSTCPIGVFWDIENCNVPTGKSAHALVQRVREKFFTGHKEAEFMCVCDIVKENRNVIEDLNIAQVDVVHINATAKNAADDKLRQSIRRFAHNHPAPATLVLITGDTNFTSEVSDLRHRHKYFVVLIHPAHASRSLKQAANSTISYEELTSDLPTVYVSPKAMSSANQYLLHVSNLPLHNDANAVRMRLRQLSENCGGKVLKLSMGTAILKFSSADVADRAMKRIDGENVFGHAIKVAVLKYSPTRHSKGYPGDNYSPGGNEIPRSNSMNPQVTSLPFPAGPHTVPPLYGSFPAICTQPYLAPATFGPVRQMMHPPPRYFAPVPTAQNFANVPSFGGIMPATTHGIQSQPKQVTERSNFGIKLTVSNIDAQLGVNTIQEVLLKEISKYCKVLDMNVRPHNRFTVVCDVTVPRLQDASNVLQNLQRQKIGTKRVLVTLAQRNGEEMNFEEASALKKDCVAILAGLVERKMPLLSFYDVYERRHQRKVKLDDLQQIQDVIVLQDRYGVMEISLDAKISDQQSLLLHLSSLPRSGRNSPDINHAFLLPVCKLHFPTDGMKSSRSKNQLLKIEMGLREFSAKLHALLHSHNGILQLDGFEYCFCAEYGTFPFPGDPEEGGVMVEHQASYVPGVQIITSQPHCLGVKAIVWAQPQSDIGSDSASDASGSSRWKSPNLIHFSREVIELLKGRPYCCLPYDNFPSEYQLHFHRPCRPSEYGFTRLSDLLTAIPHVLQVLGSLSDRVITLTHRAQVKRFTQEVVKILKTTPDRAILVAQMPELYNRTFSKVWRLRDYGVSTLSDLLDDIPEGHICTSGEGDNIVLSLPLRERSTEEKERTNQFSREVVKILRSRPRYRMPFTEFVPSYHRHFGRQCKLTNYGFSKLIDLFEALPLFVQVVDKGTEKHLALTEIEQQKILSIQISAIIRAQVPPTVPPTNSRVLNNACQGPTLPLACIPALFQQKYRFPLIPAELGCRTLEDLLWKLSHAVKVFTNESGDKMVQLARKKPLRQLSSQLLVLLLDDNSDPLDVDQLNTMYFERYHEKLDPTEYGFMSMSDVVRKALPGVIKMDLDAPECFIHMRPLYLEARAIRSVLLKNNGTMTLGEFNFAYLTTYHRPVDCEKLGFPSFEALLRALSSVVLVKGYGAKRTLSLRHHIYDVTPPGFKVDKSNGSSLLGSSSLDDLPSADGNRSRLSMWRPKVPPCMMPFWKDMEMESRNGIATSASAGNFRDHSEENIVGYQGTKQHSGGNGSFSSSHERDTSSRLSDDDVSSSDGCNFTVGEPTSASRKSVKTTGESSCKNYNYGVITLPNGSTPIASTSSCSTASSLKSSCDISSSTYSSDTESFYDESQTDEVDSISTGIEDLRCTPQVHGESQSRPLKMLENSRAASDGDTPKRIELATTFPSRE